MKKTLSNPYVQPLRRLASAKETKALRELSSLRVSIPPTRYPTLFAAIKIAAPRHAKVFAQRPARYKDLAFKGPLSYSSLENELAWAAVVLPHYVPRLNDHKVALNELQLLLLSDDTKAAVTALQAHIETFGWSFWAADLLFALTQKDGGGQAVRALASKLQVGGIGRPSVIYTAVLIDRVDEAFPYESFTAKCERSFPRFSPDWFRTYITYRATGSVSDPHTTFSQLLGVEQASSLIDYYECIIDCIAAILQLDSMAYLRDTACGLLRSLLNAGTTDPRVTKLLDVATSNTVASAQDSGSPVPLAALEARLSGWGVEAPGERHEHVGHLHEAITSAEENGFGSAEAGHLLKFGGMFKGLPIGYAIFAKAYRDPLPLGGDPILDLQSTFAIDRSTPEHYLAQPDDVVMGYLRRDFQLRHGTPEHLSVCSWVIDIVDGGASVAPTPRSLFSLWLARHLAANERAELALKICDDLIEYGTVWRRGSSKLKVAILVAAGLTRSAFEEAGLQISRDYRLAYDLPVTDLLASVTWPDVRDLDPALVGLVAHYANVVEPTGNSRFICRMACRSLYIQRHSVGLNALWLERSTDVEQRVLIAFLEDAWTEDNLALVEHFHSSHEVRRERLETFQYLLSWVPENEQQYSGFIKQLTLDETLWQGLKHVDQTRVFVNEAAVSRWAEKELYAAFERWRLIGQGVDSEAFNDELVRTYLVDPTVENLIRALPETSNTEANAALLELVGRLLKKWAADPADGLESYLSLRIRHGSLRGTVLGPLEQDNLLISGAISEQAFRKRWQPVLDLPPDDMQIAVDQLKEFSRQLQAHVRVLIDERVQIYSASKPNGSFPASLEPFAAAAALKIFSPEMSFPSFLGNCYALFWSIQRTPRAQLADFIRGPFRNELQRAFDSVCDLLSDSRFTSLVGALRSAATSTHAQCDVVGEWFVREANEGTQVFPLHVAIEIAKRGTANVYRNFSAEVRFVEGDAIDVGLSANGLAVLYDCLYVAFENAWKHSGLGSDLASIDVSATFDVGTNLLTLVVVNPLSRVRAAQISDEYLAELRARYLRVLPLDLVAREGGSGFAKLARAVNMVDRDACPEPLQFGLDGGSWRVGITIPLYDRGGRFDAYQ